MEKYIIILLSIFLLLLYCLYDTCCYISLAIIRLIHLCVIFFIIAGPFFIHEKMLLQFYILCNSFIMLHWIISNDLCALTLIEQAITGRSSSETFIGKIVKPVYNIQRKDVQVITFSLLVFALCKYLYLYGEY